MGAINVTELDHIVLNVRDIDRALDFYTRILGLHGERVNEFKAGKVGFPSVRINDHTIIDLSPARDPLAMEQSNPPKARGNLNHFCLVVAKQDFPAIPEYLKHHGFPIRQGPVSRWGARGQATSVYFLDPDGNEIEIRCY